MSDSAARFDVVVIGAGFSGLAAALRLVRFGKKVVVLESHHTTGGLNSYYFRRPGLSLYNSGLHTVTNFDASDPRWGRGYLCRALSLDPEEFQLHEPLKPARIVTPKYSIEFTCDYAAFCTDLCRLFPGEEANLENFNRLVRERKVDPVDWTTPAEDVLTRFFASPDLRDILRIPVYLYGGYAEETISWHMFRVIYHSLLMDGFCSPPSIKTLLDLLIGKIEQSGGRVLCRQPVQRILVENGRVGGVETKAGKQFLADHVISSIGELETRQMLGESIERRRNTISVFETTLTFSCPLAQAGVDCALLFEAPESPFSWRLPAGDRPEDLRYFTISASDCYEGRETVGPHHLKIGTFVRGENWIDLRDEAYDAHKRDFETELLKQLRRLMPKLDLTHLVRTESCTPRTVAHFTSHFGGGIYGSAEKNFLGSSGVENLTLCGNDRGGIGIMGAAINGVIAANVDVLMRAPSAPRA